MERPTSASSSKPPLGSRPGSSPGSIRELSQSKDRITIPLRDESNTPTRDQPESTKPMTQETSPSESVNSIENDTKKIGSMSSLPSLASNKSLERSSSPAAKKSKYHKKGLIVVASPISNDVVSIKVEDVVDSFGHPLVQKKKKSVDLKGSSQLAKSHSTLASGSSMDLAGPLEMPIASHSLGMTRSEETSVFVQDQSQGKFRYFKSTAEQAKHEAEESPLIPVVTWDQELKNLAQKIEVSSSRILLFLMAVYGGMGVLSFLAFPLTRTSFPDLPTTGLSVSLTTATEILSVTGGNTVISVSTLTTHLSPLLQSVTVQFLTWYSIIAVWISTLYHLLGIFLVFGALDVCFAPISTQFVLTPDQDHPTEHFGHGGLLTPSTNTVPVRQTLYQRKKSKFSQALYTIPRAKPLTRAEQVRRAILILLMISALGSFISHLVTLPLDYYISSSATDSFGGGAYGTGLWYLNPAIISSTTGSLIAPIVQADLTKWKTLSLIRGISGLIALALRMILGA